MTVSRMSRIGATALAAAGWLAASWGAPSAQQLGDARAGAAIAAADCASCHAIGKADYQSPLSWVPSFQEIADSPETTALALSVWLRISHPTMPNLVLTMTEIEDVSAHILSLKPRRRD